MTRIAILVITSALLAHPCPAQGVPFGPTVRVSVSSSGAEGQAPSGGNTSLSVAVSRDARFIAFESDAALHGADTNRHTDIYLHDRMSGRTTLVSTTPAGLGGDGPSLTPSISDDGRFVAFMSYAQDLVPLDGNGAPDVFVHDAVSGVTRRVSVSTLGVEGLGSNHSPEISGDGSCVAFASTAFNLVPGDTNFRDDVFVHELATGLTTLVSVSSAGLQGEEHSGPKGPTQASSRGLDISEDGSLVVFVSEAARLVTPPPAPSPGYTPTYVYLHDRGTGTTVLVGRDASGQDVFLAAGPIFLVEPGPRVILDARLTFGAYQLSISWDVNGVRTSLFAEMWPGFPSQTSNPALSGVYAVSRDGSRMATPGYLPSTTGPCVLLHHPPLGPTLGGSLNDQGELPLNGGYWYGTAISPDGRWLAWVTDASNVVSNDTNGVADVFVTDLGPWTSLGGAVATPLPTGIPVNTTNFGPPVLWGVGDLGASPGAWLTIQRAPPSAPGLLSLATASSPIAFGGATLLAWPPDFLVPIGTTSGGTAALPYVWPAGMPGVSLYVQAAFSDPLTPGALAVTNALHVVTTQ